MRKSVNSYATFVILQKYITLYDAAKQIFKTNSTSFLTKIMEVSF